MQLEALGPKNGLCQMTRSKIAALERVASPLLTTPGGEILRIEESPDSSLSLPSPKQSLPSPRRSVA